jgi:hypothetical protein
LLRSAPASVLRDARADMPPGTFIARTKYAPLPFPLENHRLVTAFLRA